uniref:Uncharacterized protein n=1 Tax=Romanomermis culicivorax TaxID=13658 RepID=A0A915ID87_ROMCU
MLEPKTQETFINPPPPMQQEIDQTPEEAKKESAGGSNERFLGEGDGVLQLTATGTSSYHRVTVV